MIVLGITGTKNSGKSTLANALCKAAPVYTMAFADPIKKIAQDMFSISSDELWGPSENRTPRTRDILQTLGTDFAKKYDPCIWLKNMTFRIEYFRLTGKDKVMQTQVPANIELRGLIISDVRFKEEAELIVKHYKGKLLRVINSNEIASNVETFSHVCETDQQNIPEDWITQTIERVPLDNINALAKELVCRHLTPVIQ